MARSGGTWRKGESGNSAGRPRNPKSLAALAESFLETGEPVTVASQTILVGNMRVEMGAETLPPKEALVAEAFRRALSGSEAATRLLWEAIDGLPPRRVDVRGTFGFETGLTEEEQDVVDAMIAERLSHE